jgi:flagellar basal-body rod protein FlgB
MNSGLLAERTTRALRYVLDYTAARQRALAHNLANVDTPAFKRFDVMFGLALAEERGGGVARTHPAHLTGSSPSAGSAPALYREMETSARADENNVEAEVESVRLAANALLAEVAGRLLAKRIQVLRAVITEGRQTA